MDVEYDENRGNHPTPECLVSIARAEPFFEATETAWPWAAPADGDMTYAVVAIIFFERLFRNAPVPDPLVLSPYSFLTNCLHLFTWILLRRWADVRCRRSEGPLEAS